jgi:4-aminobutyrate aminotransferase / (S)-3-amino-2-methylpropionate transaminase / 5-aminovalerate transaminase
MGKEFNLASIDVPRVETRFRTIVTPLPHPESLPTLEKLRKYEPQSMRGQPPIVWDRASDIFVYDKHGNRWLDWSSGVLVTNAGHAAPEICQALHAQIDSGLLHNYCFPSEERAQLVELLANVAPEGLDKVFLLTTGSEATECAIKLARAHGISTGGKKKIGIIGFERGFHGRTMGAQQAGGMAGQKSWIVNLDPAIINVPFPDGYWQQNTSFDCLLDAVAAAGLSGDEIAGVMMET